MKKWISIILCVIIGLCAVVPSCASDESVSAVAAAAESTGLHLDAKGAILMEAETGAILYAYQSREKLYPASVTKVMTMLLLMEAIDSGSITEDDPVTASENAVSYGGTQIYLEVGEVMSVRDLLKAVAVNSANDAATALGEYVAGSESAFVEQMNVRAEELGAENTHFVNPCGLPDPDHYTCAYDVALFTRELLIKHPHILDYTGIWMDSLRNGGFGLANTNKMLKTYDGMTGMKTGYTDEAGFCLSATATRGEMSLIAVVLGGETSKGRFASVASLLDYGFAGYTVLRRSPGTLSPISVRKGVTDSVSVKAEGEFVVVVPKGKTSDVTMEIFVEEELLAPVEQGKNVGTVRFLYEGQEIASAPVLAAETVEKAGFGTYFVRILQRLFGSSPSKETQ